MNSYIENYDDVPEKSYDLIPAGEYPVKVLDSMIGPSKSSGQDTWYLTLMIKSPPAYIGRMLFLTVGMSDTAKGIRKGVTEALGIVHKPVDIIKDVMNKTAIAIVYHELWQGENKPKVKRLKPIKEEVPIWPEQMPEPTVKVEEELDDTTPF